MLFLYYSGSTQELSNLFILDTEHWEPGALFQEFYLDTCLPRCSSIAHSPLHYLHVKHRASPRLVNTTKLKGLRSPFSLSEYFYCILPSPYLYSQQKSFLLHHLLWREFLSIICSFFRWAPYWWNGCRKI